MHHSPPGEPLRVLLVEHTQTDIDLNLLELKRAGFTVRADVVQTPEEFGQRLLQNRYDIILADYRLPSWTGLDALAVLRHLGQDIPFLLVTGTLGDEVAVECIKRGVADYVLKEHLGRLPLAVRRALEDAALRRERARTQQVLHDSEASFRLLFANNPLPMWVYDAESLRFLQANDAAVAHYGYSREEFLQMRIADLWGPEEMPHLPAGTAAEPTVMDLAGEWRHRLKDGRTIDVEVVSHRLEFAGRTAALVVAQDVTERKRAEEARLRAEERYRLVAETATDAFITIDLDSRILFVNAAAEKIFGYAREEMLGWELPMLMPEYLRDLHKAGFKRYLETGEKHIRWESTELTGLHKSGVEIPVEVSFGEFVSEGEHTFTGIVRDVSERKRAEAEKARLITAIEQAAEGVLITDPAGRIQYVNPAFTRMSGYSREEVIGGNPRLLKSGQHDWAFYEQLWRTILAGEIWRGEIVNRRKDGGLYAEEMSITPVRNQDGEITHFISIKQDVTKRKQAEEALRRSEARYCELVENAVCGIYRVTLPGKLLDMNPAMVKILGYDSKEELLSRDMITDVYRDPVARARIIEQYSQTGRVDGAEVEWKRKDGSIITVRLSGRAVSHQPGQIEEVEVIVEDVTERRAVEKQIHQVQKFEAIGQLAGGIAHDFNNVIGAILGWAEIGLEQVPRESPLQTHFQKIREQAQRAAGLTRQLLAFARRQVLEPCNINLNYTIADLLTMLQKVIGSNIELKAVTAPDLGVVRADPAQIEQVLMNLCLNARDAMPDGGKLMIETRNVEVGEEYTRLHSYVRPGPYVQLSVTDTGIGMDAATREHIFEPFFTTKEPGKGTGLGLATVYGVVKQHGGFVHVYSELGRGSMFQVYLPLSGEVPRQEQRKEKPGTASVRGGPETILVAEDHDGLREVARATLEGLGYRVILTCDGEQALRAFQEHRNEVALALLDVVMPKFGGQELYARICALKPDVPVIFTTGYTAEAAALSQLAEKGMAVLLKPYTPAQLGRKIRETLDRLVPAPVAGPAPSSGGRK